MRLRVAGAVAVLTLVGTAGAQQVPPGKFTAGTPVGVTGANGEYAPVSANAKVFGSLVDAESCSYDASRKLIVVPSRGGSQKASPNDAFVSLFNHDGSVHTTRWIGVTRDGLTLNQPYGSDIAGGKLYLADSDGNTADGAPQSAVIRMFDMASGAPVGEVAVPQAGWLNDLAVASDGTIYGTQTGSADAATPWRVYRVTPDGKVGVFLEGAPLKQPNGVAVDGKGNIVVVNIGDDAVLTFSPAGKLIATEHAAQPGNDGLVIMADGTKYVSSVRNGGISRIRPGKAGELIASGIPSAASMCYDPDANQLVIPMNANNALAFIKL